jgi:hypothetical protein
MVRPERFELPTYSSGGCRSIQLSYGRTPLFPVYMRSFTLSIGGSNDGVKLRAAIAQPRRQTEYSDLGLGGEALITIPAAATTPVSAAPASTISTATPAAATTPALNLRTRFIYIQSASANLSAVQRRNGFLSVFRTCHLDETEATRATGIPISHDADAVHLPVYLEKFSQFVFRSVEVEVPNKDVLQANCL